MAKTAKTINGTTRTPKDAAVAYVLSHSEEVGIAGFTATPELGEPLDIGSNPKCAARKPVCRKVRSLIPTAVNAERRRPLGTQTISPSFGGGGTFIAEVVERLGLCPDATGAGGGRALEHFAAQESAYFQRDQARRIGKTRGQQLCRRRSDGTPEIFILADLRVLGQANEGTVRIIEPLFDDLPHEARGLGTNTNNQVWPESS